MNGSLRAALVKSRPGGAMGPFTKAAIGGSVAAGAFLVGFPLAVSSLGFTAAGIAAGSVAAKMMSVAAIANGGGVAAGSTVAVLQSIGAAGLSLGAKVGLTSAFASLGALIGSKIPSGEDDEAEEPAAA